MLLENNNREFELTLCGPQIVVLSLSVLCVRFMYDNRVVRDTGFVMRKLYDKKYACNYIL